MGNHPTLNPNQEKTMTADYERAVDEMVEKMVAFHEDTVADMERRVKLAVEDAKKLVEYLENKLTKVEILANREVDDEMMHVARMNAQAEELLSGLDYAFRRFRDPETMHCTEKFRENNAQFRMLDRLTSAAKRPAAV